LKPRSAASGARSSTATATTGTAERPRGRFAPSPTGRLHAGSLYAAVGSWLDARARAGEWLLRMEDVDRAREIPGAADEICRTLEAFGLTWDGPVIRQSERAACYDAALARLSARGLTFPCTCSRRDAQGAESPRYPGTCRAGARAGRATAIRLKVEPGVIAVEDRLQELLRQDVASAVGDFVLKRRDGYYAYQLAVVVDDAEQGITDVVRGADLWDNTPRQVCLQRALNLPTPRYLHLPVLVEPSGAKLAKSRRSVPLDPARAPGLLSAALTRLGLDLPGELDGAPVSEQLSWAAIEWPNARLTAAPMLRLAQ
jgi:glutamyl-Q tRNA(Asp) synthetase